MASKNPVSKSTRVGSITVSVSDAGTGGLPLRGAYISLYRAPSSADGGKFNAKTWLPSDADWLRTGRTDAQGQLAFNGLDPAAYVLNYEHAPLTPAQSVTVEPGCAESACFHIALDAAVQTTFKNANCEELRCQRPRRGDRLYATVGFTNDHDPALMQQVTLARPRGASALPDDPYGYTLALRSAGTQAVVAKLQFATLRAVPGVNGGGAAAEMELVTDIDADEPVPTPVSGNLNISLSRTETEPTSDLKLWLSIRAGTAALAFDNYLRFMDLLFCGKASPNAHTEEKAAFSRLLQKRFLPFTDTDAYRVLKAATEAFVMVNCSVITALDEVRDDGEVITGLEDYLDRRDLPRPGSFPYLEQVEGLNVLPYLAIIRRKLPDVPISEPIRGGIDTELCDGFIQEKLRNPCMLELIWSYWQEEGMVVQTMNAITRRFQNVRGVQNPDPLANMEVMPLRPLNNLLWGYIQDEQHRLTVARRNAEYDHHYGMRLEGLAVQGFKGADSRSKFVEAFHHLLRLCTVFYKQDDDTTVKADAFGVLNALKEVHLILSQSAHSQIGDMPAVSRIEMLMQQWLLSRPEFREFLPTRAMVAYPQPWMDRVDAMKKLQGWTDTSVIHFHNLAEFGEQIMLAVRYGAWSTVFEPTQAFNFARFWRPQIQGYIHAYRAATGAELGAETVETRVDATLPSVLLQRRLASQRGSV